MRSNAASHGVTHRELLAWNSRRLRVVGVGCTALQQARLRDALRNHADAAFVADVSEIDRLTREHVVAPNVVVLSGDPIAAADHLRRLRQLLGLHTHVAVVVYLDVAQAPPSNLSAVVAAGAHQLLFTGINDSGTVLRSVFDAAQHQSAAEAVLAKLQPAIPEALHPMVEAALSRPGDVPDVRRLADAMRVTRKTLFKRCEREQFINPAELLQWTRLALVAHLLDTTASTVETLANTLGFASPTALRNSIKRYTGLRALELRAAGGLDAIAGMFARRVRLR